MPAAKSAPRRWLKKLSRANLVMLILSFIIALILWVYIASIINPAYSQHFTGIPVTVDPSNSKAEGYGLSLLTPESESQTVDVTIYGNRTAIGGISKSDLVAYVDFDTTVTDTIGKQSLPIRLRTTNGAAVASYVLSANTIDVTMDRFETRTVPVSEVQHSLSGSDAEVVIDTENIVCEPSAVTIYGPTSALSLVDHVCVVIDGQDSLYQTKTYTDCKNYTLVDADGNSVTDTAFQVYVNSFSVKVPVFYTRTLPVTVDIYNPPVGFDTDFVLQRLRLNTDQEYVLPQHGDNDLMITIETDDPDNRAVLDSLDAWTLGSVSLSSLSIGGTPIEMQVTMDSGYIDRSNLGSVYISLDASNLVADSRFITNSNIQLLNGSSRYQYTIQAGRTAYTLIGTAEDVASITAEDIKASVNLYNAAITEEGTFSQAVTLTLPDSVTNVWISPQPKVNVTASLADNSVP